MAQQRTDAIELHQARRPLIQLATQVLW